MPSTGSVTVSGEWVSIGELLLQMRGIPGLGQRCNGKIDWRGLFGGTYSCSSNSNLDNFDLLTQVQCLVNPTNTGAAMHSINPKRKLCQFCPRCL
jgi:hypothetical protein